MVSEGSDDAGHSLNLTAEERHVYGHLFRQADTESAGIVMGEVAVKFFEKTRLDSRILGEIWQIADSENRGFLTPAGFSIALRLIGHAQAGREPALGLATQPGPLPRFEGIIPPGAMPLAANTTGVASPLSAQVTGSLPLVAQGTGSVRVPPLPLDKAAQYARLFRDQAQGAAVLAGDKAKRIFERSGLPNDVLGRIWQLADTEQRGAFVQTEFVIAMHLLTVTKLGSLRGLPTALPAALYEAATRGAAAAAGPAGPPMASPTSPIRRQTSPLSGTPGVPPLPPPVQRQTTGQFRQAPPMPPPPTAQPASDWVVTPSEKVRMDQVFESLDKTKKGFITGEEAVPFLTRSGLNEDALAQIWDLADIRSEGRLTSDTFAVALYLIQRQRIDGTVPTKLPANLIPPSMRTQLRPTSPPVAAVTQRQQPPAPPAPSVPKSAMDDLFGLDTPASTTPALPALSANVTGDPFVSPLPPSSPVRMSPAPTTSSFKPFVPSSSFGRSITAQVTGDSAGSAPPATAVPVVQPTQPMPTAARAQDDLLGGDSDEASRSISNDTAELANLSNQVGSLSKHMQEVQTHRTTLQSDLGQSSQQKKNFEQRLAQLRTLYEKEARDVRGLEELLATAKTETKKLQTELTAIEATYQDMQNQHQQVYSALQADQQENGSLKGRISAVTAEVNLLKPQLEKLKSEARQQKGIVAINRKQLSLAESEREKLKADVESQTRENEELSRQIASSAPPTTVSPSVASSSGKNPFFRRTGSSDIMGGFSTPRAQSESPKPFVAERSFDDVFGPPPPAATSAAPSASTSPVPPSASPVPNMPSIPAAFKPQTTGASSASGASSTYTAATALSGPTSATATPAISRQPTFAPEPATTAPTSTAAVTLAAPAASLATSSPAISPPPAASALAAPPVEVPAPVSTPPVALEVPATTTVEATPSATETTKAVTNEAPTTSFAAAPVTTAVAAVAATAGVAAIAGSAVPASTSTPPPASITELPKSIWGHAPTDSLSDPFASLDKQQDSKAKEDFESAFASFKASKAAASSTDVTSTGDSTSGEAAKSSDVSHTDATKAIAAFDTEFPPISELARDETDSESENGFDDDFAPASPPKATEKTAATAAPISATIGSVFGSETHAAATTATTAKAPEPEATKAVDSIFAPAPVTNLDDIFSAPATAAPTATTSAPTVAAVPTVSAPATIESDPSFDDLDAEFEGLEDAKEESADDDFANISRTTDFDSPQQGGKGDSASNFGLDSSFDFGSLGSSTAAAAQNGTSNGNSTSNASDWFTSFADTPAAEAKATTTTTPTPPAHGTLEVRPAAPGRMLTDDGVHDDPLLKKLTSMGYPRPLALSALEKYDYNVDRAANYLASQS